MLGTSAPTSCTVLPSPLMKWLPETAIESGAGVESAGAMTPAEANPATPTAATIPTRARLRRTTQRPVQFGSRFSKNAFTPSWMSSVPKASESWARR